jgi:hypothetical protein
MSKLDIINLLKGWNRPYGREKGASKTPKSLFGGKLQLKHLRLPNVKSVKVLDGGLHD